MQQPKTSLPTVTPSIPHRPASNGYCQPRRSSGIWPTPDPGRGTGHRDNGPDGSGNCTEVTPEELAILRLIAGGLPMYSVAQQMRMSPRTIRRRIRGLCDRLGLVHPIQAIVWAARRGLV